MVTLKKMTVEVTYLVSTERTGVLGIFEAKSYGLNWLNALVNSFIVRFICIYVAFLDKNMLIDFYIYIYIFFLSRIDCFLIAQRWDNSDLKFYSVEL